MHCKDHVEVYKLCLAAFAQTVPLLTEWICMFPRVAMRVTSGFTTTAAVLLAAGQTTAVDVGNSKHCTYPSLYNATLAQLTYGLESGCFTSVDLVKAYLARIDEVNDKLHAVIVTNPDALSIAAQLDAERANGHRRGQLHGIPMMVKDNIATLDKMDTTAGSYALVGARVPRDSTMVAKLRASGAVILGKSNLSQFANFRSINSTEGWSSVAGQTYGPSYPNHDPYVRCHPCQGRHRAVHFDID